VNHSDVRSRRVSGTLLAVLVLATVLRFGWVLWVMPAAPSAFVYDEANFHEAAVRLLDTGYFAFGSPPLGSRPNAIGMPGYTLFVSACYSAFGTGPHGVLAVWLIQAALAVATVWLVYLIGERLGGPRVGLAGALIAALYPPLVFTVTHLMTETLYTAVLTLFVYLSLVALERPGPWIFLGLGSLAGLGALIRPAGVLIVGVPLLAVILAKKVSLRGTLTLGLAALLGLVLLLAPWWVRNYRLYERVVVFTTSSANPALAATYWPEPLPQHLSIWPSAASSDEFALNERWATEARERNAAQWRLDPIRYVYKRARMLTGALLMPHALLWLDGSPMTPLQIWTNRALRVVHMAILLLGAGAVFLRPRSHEVWLVAGAVLYIVVMYSLILPMSRYIFPSMPLVAALAGLTLMHLIDARRAH